MWLFMQAFSLKTQPKNIFQRVSPWWTRVFLSFLERICRFYGKGGDVGILSTLETDYRLANVFDDHKERKVKNRVPLKVKGIYTRFKKIHEMILIFIY